MLFSLIILAGGVSQYRCRNPALTELDAFGYFKFDWLDLRR